MNLAVIGTGISGLSAAWLLRKTHEVSVFESDARLGGHTNTQWVEDPQGPLAIDTGFIVHNNRNYPRLVALFDWLDVPTQPSDMSFAASLDQGAIEYAGDALFAQRRNVIRPTHWWMLLQILRFNRLGKADMANQGLCGVSLGDWLDQHRLGTVFQQRYLLPMAASIWSSPIDSMRDFDAQMFLEFFNNHGLLDLHDRPRWRTVVGGSRQYVERMAQDLSGCIQTSCGVTSVKPQSDGVLVVDSMGRETPFDQVIFASHADQALSLLEDPDEAERGLLGAFTFRPNRAVLHSDSRLMPKSRRAWSSWNYITDSASSVSNISLSYWMNRLQRLHAQRDYFVTLNPSVEPESSLIHYETSYTHPVFNANTRRAQRSLGRLQGHRHCWYCGAWMGYGFHEDGLGSALEVVRQLGVELPPSLEQAHRMGAPYRNNHQTWAGLGADLING